LSYSFSTLAQYYYYLELHSTAKILDNKYNSRYKTAGIATEKNSVYSAVYAFIVPEICSRLALYNFLIMIFKGGSSLHDIYTRSSFNGSFEVFSRNVRYYEFDVVKKSREKKERKREREREREREGVGRGQLMLIITIGAVIFAQRRDRIFSIVLLTNRISRIILKIDNT